MASDQTQAFDQAALDALGGLSATSENVNPDTDGSSSRNRWPDDGKCPCWLSNITVGADDFMYYLQNGQQVRTRGTSITFRYETMDQATGDDWEFDGAIFRFPADYDAQKAKLPPNIQARVEIETSRLMGHLTTILGARPANVRSGLTEVLAGFKPKTLAFELTIKSDRYKKGDKERVARKEYITAPLSVTTA